jgi:uncharacterized membrane protein YgaE (UPF0421/DUF939 family)
MTWFRRGALGEWLDAADPGALRLHHAARTALASLTAWVIIHFVLLGLAKRPMPSVGLFAVTVCFIDALVIVDARRAERRTTLLLSLAMFGLALVLASLLHATGWLYLVALLALIFGSSAARRRGLRPGELVLLLTMGLYFAQGSRVTWTNVAWFALATVIGVASLWLWQFVLLPYDPTKSLRASLRAFYRRAASLADAVAVGLEDPAKATSDNDLSRSLKQVKLSRRVIESQFPGVLAPGGWTEAEIGQMKIALYATEQGLAQMVEGASKQEHLDDIPAEIRVPLVQSMRSMQEALSTGSVESFQALAADGASLQTQIRAYARSVTGEDRSQPDTPLAPWVGTVLRLIGGSQAVAQSAGKVRRLETHGDSARQQAGQPASAGTRSGQRPPPPTVRVFGNLEMHPTTVLGLQAVVATGLAMVVARLLNVDHSNWVFWTAFVVIAGSTGESLRKMMLRVLATTGGATIGVALALLSPDSTGLVVAVAAGCIFLAMYFWPISYPQMVFWMNIGFVMVYTLMGAKEMDVLFARPVTTLLGALVAAAVVVFVFPIHTTDRFKGAVARFLAAVDDTIAAFVDFMGLGGDTGRLDAALAAVAATYAQIERTLPGVAFENSPLMQAESPVAQQATRIAALESEVTRLAGAAAERTSLADEAGNTNLMRSVQARIHRDIQTLIPLLSAKRPNGGRAAGEQKEPTAAPSAQSSLVTQERLAERLQADGERSRFQTSGEVALIRIQAITGQLVAELGAPSGKPSG